MQKKIFFFVFTLLFVSVYGQNNYAYLNSTNGDESVITFKFNQFVYKTVETPRGTENIIKAENTFEILKSGAPDLPKFTTSIIIPDDGVMNVEVLYSRYTDYTDVNIAPSKGNLLRNVNPDDVPYTYGREYEQNAFFPGNLAQLNSAYIFRDFRGQALQILPFQYNPITKVLRVYSEIKVKVSKNGNGGENVFNRTRNKDKIASDFNEIYKKQFINYSENSDKYTPIGETGKMLIICHDAWTSNVQPLVDWKNKIGRPTEMVTVTQAGGTAAAIKTYVANYYNTNGLTFLLLIGDAAQVPTNSGFRSWR